MTLYPPASHRTSPKVRQFDLFQNLHLVSCLNGTRLDDFLGSVSKYVSVEARAPERTLRVAVVEMLARNRAQFLLVIINDLALLSAIDYPHCRWRDEMADDSTDGTGTNDLIVERVVASPLANTLQTKGVLAVQKAKSCIIL